MTETASALAVLRTRLPYVDRRSLSEAWFSALHLAASRPAAGPGRGRAGEVARPGAAPRVLPSHGAGPAGRPLSAAARSYAAGIRVPSAAPREPARPLERRSEYRAFTPAAAPDAERSSRAGSLTLGVAGSRVQLVLRREGAVLHIVALCRRDVVDLVRRALAGAVLHLRSHGAGQAIHATVCAFDERAPRA